MPRWCSSRRLLYVLRRTAERSLQKINVGVRKDVLSHCLWCVCVAGRSGGGLLGLIISLLFHHADTHQFKTDSPGFTLRLFSRYQKTQVRRQVVRLWGSEDSGHVGGGGGICSASASCARGAGGFTTRRSQLTSVTRTSCAVCKQECESGCQGETLHLQQAIRVTKQCVTHSVFSWEYTPSSCLTHEVFLGGLHPISHEAHGLIYQKCNRNWTLEKEEDV